MQTYLSKERIKAIANYLNSVLPKEAVKMFRSLEERGVHLDYNNNRHEAHITNCNIFYGWAQDQFKIAPTTPKENLERYNYLMRIGQWEYAKDFINAYIQNHLKKENEIITSINLSEINRRLPNMGIINEVRLHKQIDLKAAIFYDDGFDAYLNDTFGEKTVNPEALKETQRLAKHFDEMYYGKRGEPAYNKYEYAKRMYLITGDVNLLHNILNEN